LSEDQHQEVITALEEANLLEEELRFESIGPTIGAELRQKSWMAVGLAIVGMIVYLAYAFRKSQGLVNSWKLGVAAVVALLHDLIVVTALFVLVGHFTGASIDTLFVTAMLAILGYSVNDTIILFNRMKQEWVLDRGASLVDLSDRAAKATLIRSLNTSLTTLLVLVALFLLGGATIKWFVLALSLGTIVGTYSSLFVAAPVLYWLARR
jgi:preprotein translocase subunit SecF